MAQYRYYQRLMQTLRVYCRSMSIVNTPHKLSTYWSNLLMKPVYFSNIGVRYIFVSSAAECSTATVAQKHNADFEVEFLESVVEKLRSAGIILPSTLKSTQQTPITLLRDYAMQAEEVSEYFIKFPALLAVANHKFKSIVQHLIEAGFTIRQTLELFAKYPKVLQLTSTELSEVFNRLQSAHIKGKTMVSALVEEPKFFEVDGQELQKNIGHLKGFFTHDQLLYILKKHPQLLLTDFDELEARYEYIFFKMGIEQAEIKKSIWYKVSLYYIRQRHEFLCRTGAYVQPDKKRPTLSATNPKLADILDTSDRIFATKLAGVSLEEYEVFKRMWDRQLQLEKDEEDYEIDPA